MAEPLEHRFEFLLQEWVNQNSHTKNSAGIKTFLKSLETELKLLGMKIEWHSPTASPDELGLPSALLGVLPATTKDTGPVITLVCHADTVFPIDSEFQAITWSEDRKKAVGPGVIDDKGSIMVGLFALEKLAALPNRHFTVNMLCMPSEEIGSPGFAKVLEKVSYRSQYIFGLEPSLPDGTMIHSRRGNRWIEITMRGPGGHAGRDAGKIPNPLELLMQKVTEICAVVAEFKNATISVGAFLTDTQEFNVIPASATAKLDIRFDTNELRDQIEKKIDPILQNTEWKFAEDCPAWGLDPKSTPLHQAVVQIVEKHERRPGKVQMGNGSSDCNHIARPGLIMLDGMGAIGTGLHNKSETLEVDSIFTRSKVIADLVNFIAEGSAST